MARPARHKQSGNFYYRKVIPERLREAAGMREFKRSLGTNDAKVAKRKHAATGREYEEFPAGAHECEEFREGLKRKQDGPLASPHEDHPLTLPRLAPADTHQLAGDLFRW